MYKPAFNTKSRNANAVAYVSPVKARNSTAAIPSSMENAITSLYTFSIFNCVTIISAAPININKKNNTQ